VVNADTSFRFETACLASIFRATSRLEVTLCR
jgi:hypothetical protein